MKGFGPTETTMGGATVLYRNYRQVYQTSTMGALLDGIYDGEVTIRELLRHGNLGLGTFNGLDGEMLVLSGICYQLRADGSAATADPEQRTPFAVVTWFYPERSFTVESVDRAALKAIIDDWSAIGAAALGSTAGVANPSSTTISDSRLIADLTGCGLGRMELRCCSAVHS